MLQEPTRICADEVVGRRPEEVVTFSTEKSEIRWKSILPPPEERLAHLWSVAKHGGVRWAWMNE